jgi:O-antigen/teichoic acid export membrane protein
MALGQGGLFVMQFGSWLALSRLLTPHEMGIFTLAAATAGVLSTLRTCGLSSYVVRAQRVDAALLSSVFTINLIISLATAALILGLSSFGGLLLGDPEVQRALAVLAVVPLVGVFEFRPAAMIERLGNFRAIALTNVLRGFVGNATMVALAFLNFSYMSQAYGQVASAVTAAVALNSIGRSHAGLRIGLENWREILTYGSRLFAIAGVTGIANRLMEMILAHALGLSALGLYSRALDLNEMWDNLHALVIRIVFVDLAEQQRQGRPLREIYLRILSVITMLLWPIFAGAVVLAGPLIWILLGPEWIGAAVPLSILLIGSCVLISISMTWEVFVLCDQTALQARFEFIRNGAGLLLFATGCAFGLVGASFARLGEALLALAIYRPHLQRMTETRGSDYAPIYGHGMVLTGIAVLPSAAVMWAWDWSVQTPLQYIVPAVLLGIVGWLGGLWYLRHPLLTEIQTILSGTRSLRRTQGAVSMPEA